MLKVKIDSDVLTKAIEYHTDEWEGMTVLIEDGDGKHEEGDAMNLKQLYDLIWWSLWENTPLQCAGCGRIIRRRNARMEVHSVVGVVWLCAECDDRLHSFDGK